MLVVLAHRHAAGYPGQVVGSPVARLLPQRFEEFRHGRRLRHLRKAPRFGKSVSHSHRRTSRRWNPNIQTVRAVARPGGNKQRLNVCTSCMKAGKVARG
ncbi:ribosomal protein L28 [Mycobacterium xenopi 4042]|uniref:Large ribosomal subunit protein bL28 n=1 Tax=Mycobacterium xenopi 4042 TaxID=1299334 RepID=X8E8X4_MYCXE|nr:ribosomal protein L28 [Mycobacterium xenopi 4042]